MTPTRRGRIPRGGLLTALAAMTLLLATSPGCSDGTNGGTDTRSMDAPHDGDQAPDAPTHPQNGWVVWNSNRDGNSEIYRMRADGSDTTRLTTTGGEGAKWSPDGRYIVYSDPADKSARIMHWDGSDNRRLDAGNPLFWMWDGSGVVCQRSYDFYLVDPQGGEPKLLFRRNEFTQLANKMFQPSGITHDGRYMVVGTDRYRGGYTGTNGSHEASFAAAIVELEHKDRLYFFGAGCAPRTPPAGKFVYHVCGDCPTHPDVYRMSLDDLTDRSSYASVVAHDDPDWGHSYFPRISNDNQWLAYGASTKCHDKVDCDYEIFLHRLEGPANNRVRLTNNPANDRHPDLHIGDLPALP